MPTASLGGRPLSLGDGLAPALVVLCAVLTGLAPLWVMLLAPLLFGVPHVVADLRYLVLEPPRPLPRTFVWSLAGCLATMTALRIVWLFGGPVVPRAELALGAAAVAMALFASRRLWWLLPLGLLSALALAWPQQAALLVGHVHNFVALALFLAWAGPNARRGVLGAVIPVLLALMLGAGDSALVSVSAVSAGGLRLSGLVEALAPDLGGVWGLRAVGAFAFMQAVHYALWLVAIPVARHENPLRGWVEALGPGLLLAAVVGTVGLLGWGARDPVGARAGYLGLVLFHGWLELAVAAYWLGGRD